MIGEELKVVCNSEEIPTEKREIGFVFSAEGGKSYTLTPNV